MGSDGIRSLECTLATTMSSSGEEIFPLVELAVFEDVHLDPGQDTKWGKVGIQLADQGELTLQTAGRQPVRDGEPRRVIGQRDPLMAEVAGSKSHLIGRAATV